MDKEKPEKKSLTDKAFENMQRLQEEGVGQKPRGFNPIEKATYNINQFNLNTLNGLNEIKDAMREGRFWKTLFSRLRERLFKKKNATQSNSESQEGNDK